MKRIYIEPKIEIIKSIFSPFMEGVLSRGQIVGPGGEYTGEQVGIGDDDNGDGNGNGTESPNAKGYNSFNAWETWE